MNSTIEESTRLTRIGTNQHQRLKIIAAMDGRSMIQLLNDLIDDLDAEQAKLATGKRGNRRKG